MWSWGNGAATRVCQHLEHGRHCHTGVGLCASGPGSEQGEGILPSVGGSGCTDPYREYISQLGLPRRQRAQLLGHSGQTQTCLHTRLGSEGHLLPAQMEGLSNTFYVAY